MWKVVQQLRDSGFMLKMDTAYQDFAVGVMVAATSVMSNAPGRSAKGSYTLQMNMVSGAVGIFVTEVACARWVVAKCL